MQISLHKYQLSALLSEKRIIALISGIQSGKSSAGAIWMRKQISQFKDPHDSFLVTSPTYSMMISSTMPTFMRYNKELGILNKGDRVFILKHNGSRVIFRSMDNPDSCEGISRVRAAWLDEAGLYSSEAWINIQARTSPMMAQCFLSTTPYNLSNFLYRDIYQPFIAGVRDDIDLWQFRSTENPVFPMEEFERQKKLLDPRVFSMKYEGIFSSMAGLVYPDFDYANYCDPFLPDPNKYHICAGIDFGFADPTAVVILAIKREGGEVYQVGELFKVGLTPAQQVSMAQQLTKQYRISQWFGDSASPGIIESMKQGGLNITGVSKPAGSVAYGIGRVTELIRLKTFKMFRGKCCDTEREFGEYVYAPPKDGKYQNVPLGFNDHCMDALRYAIMSTSSLRARAIPVFKPQPTHLQSLLGGKFKQRIRSEDEW